jgi:hypothetical protein
VKKTYAERVKERIEFLKSQGAEFKVSIGIYGVEITHYRPGFGKRVSTTTEIITRD